jgi:hypothetical protein
MCSTQVFDVLDGFMTLVDSNRSWSLQYIHLVRISHLLDLLPGEFGRIWLSSSKRFFISLRRFLSAILWLTRSSGVRL